MSKKLLRSSRPDIDADFRSFKSVKLDTQLNSDNQQLPERVYLNFNSIFTPTNNFPLFSNPQPTYIESYQNNTMEKEELNRPTLQEPLGQGAGNNMCEGIHYTRELENIEEINQYYEILLEAVYNNDPSGEKVNLEIKKKKGHFEEACYGGAFYQFFIIKALPTILKRDILGQLDPRVKMFAEKDIFDAANRLGEMILNRDFFQSWYQNLYLNLFLQ